LNPERISSRSAGRSVSNCAILSSVVGTSHSPTGRRGRILTSSSEQHLFLEVSLGNHASRYEDSSFCALERDKQHRISSKVNRLYSNRQIITLVRDACLLAAFALCLAACGSMSSSLPAAPTPVPAAPAPAPVIPAPTPVGSGELSGTWTGAGSDSFSPERITLVVNHTGGSISGTAEINAVDPADGTCGSCHKVKRGTLTGTLSAEGLTISMKFPSGGDVPAPICDAEFNARATVTNRRITGTYTGSDTCEGMYTDGVIELIQQ